MRRTRRSVLSAALAATILAAGWLAVPAAEAACGMKCVAAPTPTNLRCKVCVNDPTAIDGCGMPGPCRCLPHACPIFGAAQAETPVQKIFSPEPVANRCETPAIAPGWALAQP